MHDELMRYGTQTQVNPLMEKAAWLSVPLTVDISEGKNWGAKG